MTGNYMKQYIYWQCPLTSKKTNKMMYFTYINDKDVQREIQFILSFTHILLSPIHVPSSLYILEFQQENILQNIRNKDYSGGFHTNL
jgi:hypothetical protein